MLGKCSAFKIGKTKPTQASKRRLEPESVWGPEANLTVKFLLWYLSGFSSDQQDSNSWPQARSQFGQAPPQEASWEQPSGEGLGGIAGWKTEYEPTVCAPSPAKCVLSCIQSNVGSRARKGIMSLLRPHLDPVLGPPTQEECGPVRVGPYEAMKVIKGLEHLFYWRQGWESWCCSTWRREGFRGTLEPIKLTNSEPWV